MNCAFLLTNLIFLIITFFLPSIQIPFTSSIRSSYKLRSSNMAAVVGFSPDRQTQDPPNILGANVHASQAHVPSPNSNVPTGGLNQVNLGAAANSTSNGTAGNANGASSIANFSGRLAKVNRTKAYVNRQLGQRSYKHLLQRRALKIQVAPLKNRDHCPFDKLPVEIRMNVFKYILPNTRTFVPTWKGIADRAQGAGIPSHIGTPNDDSNNAGNIIVGNPLSSSTTQNTKSGRQYSIADRHPLFRRLYWEFNPGKMTMPLMLTNRKICEDVATILYEENTFELHIHADGLDFLNLPRLNIVKDHGLLENILFKEDKFKNSGAFCFRRIKHPRFVLFGGSLSDRTAGMRMRQIISKLVELFEKEEKPLTSVEVDFRLESGAWDNNGNFWIEKDIGSARRSVWHSVSNIELITSPLLRLRNIQGKISFPLPRTVTNAADIAYKESFEHTLRQPVDYVCESQFKPEFDNVLMDAVVDYQLQNAMIPVDKPGATFVPLLTEEDILAEAYDEEEEDDSVGDDVETD